MHTRVHTSSSLLVKMRRRESNAISRKLLPFERSLGLPSYKGQTRQYDVTLTNDAPRAYKSQARRTEGIFAQQILELLSRVYSIGTTPVPSSRSSRMIRNTEEQDKLHVQARAMGWAPQPQYLVCAHAQARCGIGGAESRDGCTTKPISPLCTFKAVRQGLSKPLLTTFAKQTNRRVHSNARASLLVGRGAKAVLHATRAAPVTRASLVMSVD